MGFLSSLLNLKSNFNLDSDSFAKKIKEENNYVILDVRTYDEYKHSHIKNSINMDIYQNNFVDKIKNLDKTKSYFVYCKSGSRSYSALKLMNCHGFNKVYNLEGGLIKWHFDVEKII